MTCAEVKPRNDWKKRTEKAKQANLSELALTETDGPDKN